MFAAIFFVFLSLTDLLDGYIARKYNQVTDLGKFLDPLADKILVVSILILFAVQMRVDVYSVMLIVVREFVITGFRVIAASKGKIIAASKSAKWKTATQMIAIFLIIADWPYGLVLYYVSVLIAIYSMIEYMVKNSQVLKEVA